MANLVPPEALKQIKPYLTLAVQLEQRNEKSVAYYCRLYAVQHGMEINKKDSDCKKFLFQLMDILETTKKQNPGEESIHSDVVGQAYVEKYALRIFEKADDDDRQSRFNKNLVKQFYSAGLLFDILNCFGELSEDLVQKKQYAKRKAMYLNRCFQTGETPIPGPLTGEGAGDEFGLGFNEQTNYDNSNTNYQPTNYPPEVHQSPSANQNENRPSSSKKNDYYPEPNQNEKRPGSTKKNADYYPETNYHEDTSHSAHNETVSAEVIQKAQKFCKHAQSALQYDDVPTAITNLEQCLKLLKTGKA